MNKKLSLTDLDLKNKRALVRVDFNVPVSPDGNITDDTRIRAALPTIEYILKQGGSVILMSHLGRPEGKKDPKFSMGLCARHLEDLLKKPVPLAPDCIGPEVEKMAKSLKNGQLLMLENLRFHAAEEKPDSDPSFAKKLASLGEVYINDAFGTAHRAHSSTATITKYFPKTSAAGFLLKQEMEYLGSHFANPKRPFFALIGGAKISSKLGVLISLLNKVDALFIGGGMAYTFFKAQGLNIGRSICENDLLGKAKDFLDEAKKRHIPLYLPEDLVITQKCEEGSPSKVIEVIQGIPEGWEGVDIGPRTLKNWSKELEKAKMIFWNGPFGVFEIPSFAKGTQEMAKILSQLKAITIVGGGDSVAAVNQFKLGDKFSHLSTGGGAALEYIELGHLPGIDSLTNKI